MVLQQRNHVTKLSSLCNHCISLQRYILRKLEVTEDKEINEIKCFFFLPVTYLLNLVANLLSPKGYQKHIPFYDFSLQRIKITVTSLSRTLKTLAARTLSE